MVPEYIVELVENYMSSSNIYREIRNQALYKYYMIYYNYNNDYYDVCLMLDEDNTVGAFNYFINYINFYNVDFRFYLKFNESANAYINQSSAPKKSTNGVTHYSTCYGNSNYAYVTNYFELNSLTENNSSSVVSSIDYQPYFLLVTCAIILVFFVLMFKRRR